MFELMATFPEPLCCNYSNNTYNCAIFQTAHRLWGKVVERAAAVKGGFDAASLSAFFWGATTAGEQ